MSYTERVERAPTAMFAHPNLISMHRQFTSFFCDPQNGRDLVFEAFEEDGENLLAGLFFEPESGNAYGLYRGVPVFLPEGIPGDFIDRYGDRLRALQQRHPALKIRRGEPTTSWSFSLEWEAHADHRLDSTWGMSTRSRYEQFLLETGTSEAEIAGRKILDAGCGNGMLTEQLARQGSLAFGADYSTSVFAAEQRRTAPGCCFLQCDLRQLPFKPATFHLVVSNGVIHHTPDPKLTFERIAEKTAEGGRFYLWLYSRKGSVPWRVKRRVFDLLRVVFSRAPNPVQKQAVRAITGLLYGAYRLAGAEMDRATLLVNIYDSITPRWRSYHTPEQVSAWYHEQGFGPVTLTHWDNRYGFGVVATRLPMTQTPGEHYVPRTPASGPNA